MRRFRRSFVSFGIFGLILAVIFLFTVREISVGLILFVVPCFAYRRDATFRENEDFVTLESGFWPWLKRRQIPYAQIEKLLMQAWSSRNGATFEIRLALRGEARPIRLSYYGEEDIRKMEAEAVAVAAMTSLPLDQTPEYIRLRDSLLSSKQKRHRLAVGTLVVSFLLLFTGLYFTLAHGGYPVPFQESIEALFDSGRKGNTGSTVQLVGWGFGIALGLIGLGSFMQTRGGISR